MNITANQGLNQRTMIVAESMARRLTAFDVAHDGTLSNQRIWAETGSYIPDGICLDADGAVWVADAGGPHCVRVLEGGQVTEVLDTEQRCFACMLGGEDGRTLFMVTAAHSLAAEASVHRSGKILTTRVAVGHAGRP